jgi:predicted metalloprotease with PDZ domain
MPGRRVQSVAQASFDAWNKYYRQDENTPNSTISYYTKGAQVALCLDLTLRREGRGSLDAVMRQLWALGADSKGNIGITEADIAQALQAVGGRSFEPELRAWVHGRADLPIDELLPVMGMVQTQEPERLSAAWGLRLNEGPVTGCVVRQVLRGSAAESAGLCAGDEILAVQGWRVRRLDDAAQWLSKAAAVELLINRDQRILPLKLQPKASATRVPTLQWALDDARAKADPACAARRQLWWSASS